MKIIFLSLCFMLFITALFAEEALFSVTTTEGDTIFAVYPSGIKVIGEDGEDVMIANRDSIRMYFDETQPAGRASRGGFAVGGVASRSLTEYFRITPDSVRIYVNEIESTGRASRGGFAVGGVASRGGTDYLYVTPDSTRVFVEDATAGFGVESIETGLEGSFLDITQENYFIGHNAGAANTLGLYNNFIGYDSGSSNTTGSNNLFLGFESGDSNTEGVNNVFMGYQSGKQNIGVGSYTGDYNVFIGYRSGMNSGGNGVEQGDAQSNVFIGNSCGRDNTTGRYNLFLGNNTGLYNQTGIFNSYVGSQAGLSNIVGRNNTFIGYSSGYRDTTSNNTFIGYFTAFEHLSGQDNTIIGLQAGRMNQHGSGNVFIGNKVAYNEDGSNKLYIDNSNTSTPLIYGEFDNEFVTINGDLNVVNDAGSVDLTLDGSSDDDTFTMTFREDGIYKAAFGWQSLNDYVFLYEGGTNSLVSRNGKIGIGIVDPLYKMELQNNISYALGKARAYSWVTYSDGRLKKSRSSLKYGLKEIMKLNPIEYDHHSSTNENGKLEILEESERTIGLIAQEVDKIIPEAANEPTSEIDLWSMDYQKLIPVLIKAIQEQQETIDSQQIQNDKLEERINKIEVLIN